MSNAGIGYLSKYYVWDASLGTPALVKINEVIELSPGAESSARVEVTHMESPNRRQEFIAGLIDPGEGSFSINWVPNDATDILLRGLLESGAVVQHKVEFPNGVSTSYDAAIIGYEKAVPIDDRMTATVTVAVSGVQTWAAA